MASFASFLEAQSKEYQGCLKHIQDLTVTLEHQRNIQISQIIPKKTSKSSLTEEFDQKFQELFFQHLSKVITSNTIKLQILEANAITIITQTEKYLSSLPLSLEQLRSIHSKFVSDNSLEHHTLIPALQSKLHSSQPRSNTGQNKRRPKRKHPTPAPQPEKRDKQDHFLSIGPNTTLEPS